MLLPLKLEKHLWNPTTPFITKAWVNFHSGHFKNASDTLTKFCNKEGKLTISRLQKEHESQGVSF